MSFSQPRLFSSTFLCRTPSLGRTWCNTSCLLWVLPTDPSNLTGSLKSTLSIPHLYSSSVRNPKRVTATGSDWVLHCKHSQQSWLGGYIYWTWFSVLFSGFGIKIVSIYSFTANIQHHKHAVHGVFQCTANSCHHHCYHHHHPWHEHPARGSPGMLNTLSTYTSEPVKGETNKTCIAVWHKHAVVTNPLWWSASPWCWCTVQGQLAAMSAAASINQPQIW